MNAQIKNTTKERTLDPVIWYTRQLLKESRDVEIEPYLLSNEEIMLFNFNILFAKRIKQKRKELGWTQAVLAEKSGVNRITIARIEKYQHTASVEVIIKLLYALKLKLTITEDDVVNTTL